MHIITLYLTIIIALLFGQYFPHLSYFQLWLYFLLILILTHLIKIKQNWIITALLFGLIISSLRLGFLYKEKNPSHISNFINMKEKVSIKGKICDEIDKRSHKTKLTICTKQICFKKNKLNICKNSNWKILANISNYPEFQYWDEIKIFWKLISAPEDEDFSYKNYLSRYEIYWLISFWNINKIWKWKLNIKENIYSQIFKLKNIFLKRISLIYPEPHWSFLSWLLVWARKWLPKEVSEDFQKNWLAHLVAISGYNITLLMVIIAQIFWFLWKKISFYISTISIIVFTIFVWASSAVVRASIMWILNLIALKLWRSSLILLSTMLTASIISLYNPKILWWDLWFQLSFLALIWVIWLIPTFPKFIKKIPDFLWLKEAIILTIAASITTLPIMAYNFWKISIISPIANLFVAPLTPLAMLFWFFSIISPFDFIKQIFWFITYCFLNLALKFSHYFASFKYASIDLQTNWIQTILLLIVIFWLMIWKNGKTANKK